MTFLGVLRGETMKISDNVIERRIQAVEAVRRRSKERQRVIDELDVKPHIARVYHELHDDIARGNHEFINLPGGRGSCKSSFCALEIIHGIMKDTTGHSNAIVFRLYGNTLRESVFSQIAWAIDELGVAHLWRGSVSPMVYTYIPTGQQIFFRGLNDASRLKSIKPRNGTFKFVWFEEFSELPGPNFTRNVLQSVMRGGDTFTVFRSFNPPISANNWANVFIREPNERATTLQTDYTMIPPEWLGEAFLYEAQRLKEVNPQAFEHEYMGIPTGTGGEVFPNLEIREITDAEISNMGYIYQGLDFGFAQDPAAFLRVSYDRKHDTIYFLDEIYKRGLSNAQLAEEIKAKGYHKDRRGGYVSPVFGVMSAEGQQIIIADCAEPKSIQDLRDNGLKVIGCHKEPGCVEYRVKWLQHRRIVIDPARTPNAYREFVNYEYMTDKDGNFLSRLPDKENHQVDSLAYALDKLIYHQRGLSA